MHSLAEQTSSPATEPVVRSPWPVWGIALFGILVIANVIPIWSAERFPSQNGPWFLTTVRVFRDIDQPGTLFSEYFVRNWHPIPHMLHHTLILAVSHITSLPTAEKIVLSLHVLLMPLSLLVFVRTVAPDRAGLGFLAFLMIFTYPFMRGYHNFSLSIPLYFFTLSYWLRVRTLERIPLKHWVSLATMATLVYLAHLLAFGLLFGTIGWYELVSDRRPVRATLRALGATWPGWLLFLDYEHLNRTQSQWIDKEDIMWHPWHWNVQYFVERYFYSISIVAFIASVVAWSTLVALLIVAWRNHGNSAIQKLRAIVSDPLASLTILLVIAYMVLPYKFLGWHKVNIRLIPFVLGLTLACVAQAVPAAAWRRWRTPFLLTILATGLTASTALGMRIAEMGRTVSTYVSGIDQMEPNSKYLSFLVTNPAFGNVRPITRAYEHYLIETGSVHGRSVAKLNTLAMVWYKHFPVTEDFPLPPPDAPVQEFREATSTYDYVLVWGTDETLISNLNAAGFHPIHERGEFRMFENEKRDVDGNTATSPAMSGLRIATVP